MLLCAMSTTSTIGPANTSTWNTLNMYRINAFPKTWMRLIPRMVFKNI